MKFLRISLVFFSLSCASFGQSARDIARNAFKSVVLLEMNDSNGQPLSLGSGFFVSSGIIATNAHVIEGASSGTAKLVGDSHTLQILGTIAVDRHADLALLKVDSHAPPLTLGPNTNPIVGDNVYVVGNPLGLEGTFSNGIISGVRHIDADSVLQMTAPISPGSSGGPVMDNSGAVIGIAVATFRDGQNLNLAVPVSALSQLLASALTHTSVTLLGKQEVSHENRDSMVDRVGTRAELGVIATNFEMAPNAGGSYEFRLINKLPVGIFNIRVRIIYYDASKSVMDFEDFFVKEHIPSGLTKSEYGSFAITEALYYCEHTANGSRKDCHQNFRMKPIVELRVIDFSTEESK
jgi:S1-C subfamily serine protease